MRFIWLLLLAGALAAGLYMGLLYGFLPYKQLASALDAANAAAQLAAAPIRPQSLAHTPQAYALLRALAGGLAFTGALGLWIEWRHVRRGARRLIQDGRRASVAVKRTWRQQSRASQAAAWAGLAVIVGLRTYYLVHNPLNGDEVVTTDYFVFPGPAVTASFYLLPNNHILSSLLAWPLLRFAPMGAPDLLVRLPTFIIGVVGLVVSFLALASLTKWRIAALATLVFNLSPMGLEYASTARGYGPQALCVQACLLAALVLARGPAGHRLAWAVWLAASVAGFYFIPTFLYPWASLSAGIWFGARHRTLGRLRAQVLVAGAGVGALVLVLYLPIGWLSGWPLLLANPFVQRAAPDFFWRSLLPYYFPVTATILYGRAVLGWGVLALLVVGPLIVAQWAPQKLKPTAWLAYAAVVGPVPLVMVQQVMPPARVFHYTVWALVLVAGIVLDALTCRVQRSKPAIGVWALIAVASSAYCGLRIRRQIADVSDNRQLDNYYREAERHLSKQHPRSVSTTAPAFGLYVVHQAMVQHRPYPVIPTDASRLFPCDYLVVPRTETVPARLAGAPYTQFFCNPLVCIYRRGFSSAPAVMIPPRGRR